jgi:hypothetical protein
MMSTADSAMLAFSTMWVRDVYTKYVRRNAGHLEQIVFGYVRGRRRHRRLPTAPCRGMPVPAACRPSRVINDG